MSIENLPDTLYNTDRELTVEDVSSQLSNAGMFNWLAQRLGENYLRQRLQHQIDHADEVFDRGRRILLVENSEWLMVILFWGLKLIGLYNRGNRNFLDVQTNENEVVIPHLPDAFDGYRILHLSDLHLDMDLQMRDAITKVVEPVEYDLAVITGDFRASTGGAYQLALEETIAFTPVLKKPIYAILGNHDFIEFVKPLEDLAGLSFLINESVPLKKDGATIWLTGVDDPHMYDLDNVKAAYTNVPADATKILLSHSPETWQEAAEHDVDFMMAGHTHAGQICLPGGIPIIVHAKCPREMITGAWEFKGMQGYTSSGTGGCGVPVRFNCRPEITIHTLRRKQSESN